MRKDRTVIDVRPPLGALADFENRDILACAMRNSSMKAGRLLADLDMSVNLAGRVAETSIASAAIAHLAVVLPRLDWGTSVTRQYHRGRRHRHADWDFGRSCIPSQGCRVGSASRQKKLETYGMDIR